MKDNSQTGRFASFFKRNGYYILLVACVLAITAIVTVSLISRDRGQLIDPSDNTMIVDPNTPKDPVEDEKPTDQGPVTETPTVDVDTKPVIFALPVANGTIGMDYSIDTLVFSNTLNQWQVHKGIDFKADEGTYVCAAYEGTVVSVTPNDILNGGTVVIRHDNGLTTLYSSLASDIVVSVGDFVRKGDVIGTVSNSAYASFKEGPHVHFEVLLNNQNVNPRDYLDMEEK